MAEIDIVEVRKQHRIVDVLKSRYGVKVTGRKCSCPIPGHPDSDPSFSVFTERKTGLDYFKCQGCGASGDVIQLVSSVEGIGMREAAASLNGGSAPEVGPLGPTAAPEPPKLPALIFDEWIPPSAAAPVVGARIEVRDRRGELVSYRPDAVYTYRNSEGKRIAIVMRSHKGAKGKVCTPLRWVNGAYCAAGFVSIDGEQPPIYNLNGLTADLFKPVLLVEGEKCVDYARAAFPNLVPVSWMGGTARAHEVDWSPLNGRDVIVWADNDAPGYKAMEVIKNLCKPKRWRELRLPEEKAKGWDVADALDEALDDKLSPADVLGFLMANLFEQSAPPAKATKMPKTRLHGVETPVSEWLPEGEMLVYTALGGLKQNSSVNSFVTLQNHPSLKGKLAYDVFDHEILWEGEVIDDHILFELQKKLYHLNRLEPQIQLLRSQVSAVAMGNRVNRLVDALTGLEWDRKHRLMPGPSSNGLLCNYAGVAINPYTEMAGARWFFGMIRRLVLLEWKHDYVLVIEGSQGARKTSFFQTLAKVAGWDLYTDLSGNVGKGDKDELLKFRGKAIVELAEMTSHRKSDADAFKSFIDKKVDHYRPPYAHTSQAFPRRCVFAGTTNQLGQYLNDPTGSRRMWPVLAPGLIDIDGLALDVEQIWAEAMHYGLMRTDGDFTHPNYLVGDEIPIWKSMVEDRETEDPWTHAVQYFVEHAAIDPDIIDKEELWDAIPSIMVKDRSARDMARLSEIMQRMGYRYGQGTGGRGGRKWRRKVLRP